MAARSSRTRSSAAARRGARRTERSLEAFRDALERSVTISSDRLQEIVDDSVKRGRMTRKDANELVFKVVSRGRRYRRDLLRDVERLLEQARRQATTAAGKAGRAARDVADQPMKRADALRRRAGVGTSFPITAYDQLTATQVRSRLAKLGQAELRKVRSYEQKNKARKGILSEIERRLDGGKPARRSTARPKTATKRAASRSTAASRARSASRNGAKSRGGTSKRGGSTRRAS